MGMKTFQLSWPQDDFQQVIKAVHDREAFVYGNGRQDGTLYTISKRRLGDDDPKSDNGATEECFLSVPLSYGSHLEHLCYLIHYFWLAWQWMVERNEGQTSKWDTGYGLVAESMIRSFKYHSDALALIGREVRKSPNGTLPSRIETLNEWAIRRKFGLEDVEMESLLEAENRGIFEKDVLKDPEHFGEL
jgi:hypothetical protein